MDYIDKIIELWVNLPKNIKYIFVGVIALLLFILLIGGIGSNNDIDNVNHGIQGNGNNQNSNNPTINGNKNIQGNGNHVENKYYNINKEEKAFKENFTLKKNGLFVVSSTWEKKWKPYLTIYNNFVDVPTPKGYMLLNSPELTDNYKFYSEKAIEVSGYIRTTNGIFYMTKYSYDNRNKEGFPKFIYPIK